MLEAAQHKVKRVCDAEYFSSDILEPQELHSRDIVMINLEYNRSSNFQLLNLLMEREEGPFVIVMANRDGSFRQSDQFKQARFQFVEAPFQPHVLLSTVEAVL
jgi:DNA-binding NtrC family response regulator